MKKIFRNKFILGLLFILLISFGLRFFNYQERFGLAYDQAHDAIVARYALEEQKIPLVGPFSSGARFQTSGIWYWYLMLTTAFYKQSFLTPWVLLTALYALFAGIITILASKIIDKKFGLLVGFITAISTAQVTQSLNLTLTAPMSFISLGAIYSMFVYVRKRSLISLFFLSFFCGLAASVHLQGVPLILLLLLTLIFTRPKNIKAYLIILLAFILPFLPLIIFDLQNDFVNIKGLIEHVLYNQFKVSYEVLGRRWLTYATVFWPNALALIIGGNIFISYLLIVSTVYVIVYKFLKRQIPIEWSILFLAFAGIAAVLRYVRTPLFDSYLVFLHPFIFLIAAWTIFNLFKRKILFGVSLFILMTIFTLGWDLKELKKSDNYSLKEREYILATLASKFSNERFSIYSYQYKWADKDLILSLYLYSEGKIDEDGRKIGVFIATQSGELNFSVITDKNLGYQLVDLQSFSSSQLKSAGWGEINPRNVYESTEHWYKK